MGALVKNTTILLRMKFIWIEIFLLKVIPISVADGSAGSPCVPVPSAAGQPAADLPERGGAPGHCGGGDCGELHQRVQGEVQWCQ